MEVRQMVNCKICPWWLGYLLINPLRLLWHNPEEILKNHLTEGMQVLDIGPGMGFFTLPMAKLVGNKGRVIAIDLQEKMLNALKRRANRQGINNIETRNCASNTLEISDLNEKIDFALAFAMVHEVPDSQNLLNELFAAIKKGGRLLIAEPQGHVSKDAFAQTINKAERCGFTNIASPEISKSLAVLLEK
jgi:ubiquinone/menaquinone biosynthesis C-methylase UbiE